MGVILKLIDEQVLISDLKCDTVRLIKSCHQIEPVRRFVTCYDILDLTLEIQRKFPTEWPKIPLCDEGALLQLLSLTQELSVYHWRELPQPDFGKYRDKVNTLLRVFQLPKRLGY